MSTPMTTYSPCPDCRRLNRVAVSLAPGGKTPICGSCKTELALHGAITIATAAGLQALVQKSPLPVVADFWAPWCGPCRAFAPTFEAASRELAGKIVFAKVDTEAQPLAGSTYGIRSIPTLIVFNQGLERARQSGALSAPMLQQWLAPFARSGGESAA